MKPKQQMAWFGVMLLAGLWAPASLAQVGSGGVRSVVAVDKPSVISPTNVDLRALKRQLEAFQNILNRSIQQNFEQPFSLLQDAKGIYLPGYGVAFHMEINLHPMRLAMPFGIQPYTPEELRKAREDKLVRIRQLRSRLSELLLQHGGDLSAMAPEQNISVVVHLFNLPSEGRDLPSQLVMTVNRTMLLDYQSRRLTAEQFQNTSSVLEF